jgi:archaemetzincin
MLRYSCHIILLLISVSACVQQDHRSRPNIAKKYETGYAIGLLPFKGADKALSIAISKGLEKRLNAKVTVLGTESLPATAYYKPRQRYIADELLVFLKQYNDGRFDKIIGLTKDDISTQKESVANWGVMGHGQNPGQACVISSYRVSKGVKNTNQFNKRMLALALHELGHTWSLPHCNNDPCIMRDAEGKMNLDYSDAYCYDCTNYLGAIRTLK